MVNKRKFLVLGKVIRILFLFIILEKLSRKYLE